MSSMRTILAGLTTWMVLSGCGASPVGGSDPARATFFKATMLDAQPLPGQVKLPLLLQPLLLADARLVPMDLGRTTDRRIFDDRGGSGSSGGGRDSTASTGRMADVRIFSSVSGALQTDSVAVDVVRIGDILYITRPHPDPKRNVTDTAFYENGVLIRKMGYWREVVERPTGQVVTYTVVN